MTFSPSKLRQYDVVLKSDRANVKRLISQSRIEAENRVQGEFDAR